MSNKRQLSGAKRITTLAVCVAVALVLSFIEAQIPPIVPIPGIKLGLANMAIIFVLYRFGARDAACVSLLRVALSSLLFGSITGFIYGMSGAVLSFLVMALLRYTPLGTVGVSTLGGVSHNLAQIATASLIMQTNVVVYYLPYLLLSGTIAGVVIGIGGAMLVKKVPEIN